MMKTKFFAVFGVIGMSFGLTACNTASTPSNAMTLMATTGGATVVTDKSAFDKAFQAAQGQLATQTPLTGSASYKGQVSVRTTANAADTDESVYGDLAMTVNFAPNQARPISATVDNISGNINGQATDVAGSLSTANAPTQINAVTATNVNIPIQGQITSTGLSVGMEGKLTDPTGTLSGDALMILQGTMVGTNGASTFGSNSVVIKPASGANVITGGTFYANKN